METVCEVNMCTGCMACANKCRQKAITICDNIKNINAIIDVAKCVNCGICKKICPQLNLPNKLEPVKWFQGWAENEIIRESSSSGGVAACITKTFIENGGYVCSCVFESGEFKFIITNCKEEARKFSGSKYVKSNTGDVYEKIKKLLDDDKKVLFIGLPCQVAGLKNYLQNAMIEGLYTVDLVCHGTPSVKTLELFLRQNGIELQFLKDIRFRNKSNFGLGFKESHKSISMKGTVDAYLLSFLNALNYTDNCYHCKYSSFDRVSDITLGDNWGTELDAEIKKGISLILLNSDKGKTLISNAHITLKNVDINQAISANAQLREPSHVPSQRDWFIKELAKGKNYKSLVRRILPKQYFRQVIKGYAIKLHLKNGGGYGITCEQ